MKFVNINTAEFDAYKVGAIPVVADARVALEQLGAALDGPCKVSAKYAAEIAELKAKWDAEVDRLFHLKQCRQAAQSEVIGAMWEAAGERDVLLSAAGSHPGDLHKLWRTRTPNGYHMEYGYSCMGYEIPGAMGAKLADPSREVYVFLGDGTYLMAPTEIVTSVQEGIKIIIVLVDNHGFASIGSLSRSLGQGGFGTRYRARNEATGQLDGEVLTVDFAANARSLGAHALKAGTLDELKQALEGSEDAGPHHGDRGGDGSYQWACRDTIPGGMLRWPKFRSWRACARPEHAMKKRASANAIICEEKKLWSGCRILLTEGGARRARAMR